MYDIESTNVLFTVNDDTCSSHVTATSDHDNVASVELDEVNDLSLFDIELDGIVDLDEGVGITDGSAVVGDNVRDALGADGDLADLEELVLGFLGGDAVDCEAALDVVEETEVLARLLNGDDIF